MRRTRIRRAIDFVLPCLMLAGVAALIARDLDAPSALYSAKLLGAVTIGAVVLWKLGGLLFSRARVTRRTLDSVDRMDGAEFEDYMRQLLRLSGFSKVEVTAATGDYGADLVGMKDGERYIFQCKRHEANVGVKAVQEIHTAKAYYGSDCEVVVTNSYFTKNACTLAEESGVLLWDRDVLAEMIRRFRKGRAAAG